MNLNGMDALRRHLPDVQTGRGLTRLALIFLVWFALTLTFFYWVDRLIPDWMPDGEIVIIALGFLWRAQFYTRRANYLKRYGDLAYRHAFIRFATPGLAVLIAALLHLAYLPGPAIPAVWWRAPLVAAGAVLVILGAALWVRSVLAFGADNAALLYVYYPAEGHLIDEGIYAVLRHPIYAGILYGGIGLGLIHANWFSLVVVVLLPLGFIGWTRLVEEKELIERVPAYADYRRRVPAFLPRLRDLGGLLRFLILGH
jgi:protein-S-isoprenylcysteine O-methyltransferase Ste14